MSDLLAETVPEPEDLGELGDRGVGIGQAVADRQKMSREDRDARNQAILRGRPRKRRQAVDLKEVTPETKALIERKLDNAGGTLREIAAFVQQRLGTDCSPEGYDSPQEKERLAKIFHEEMEILLGTVKGYLEKEYGKPIKNSFGQTVGMGDRITVERGHYFRNY